MNLIGRKFQNKSGKVCTIKDVNEDVTTFSDGSKVDTKFLLDKKYFVEVPTQQVQENYIPTMEKIDPNLFFNQRNPLYDQISSIPNDLIEKLPVDNLHRNNHTIDNSSAVLQYDEEREKEELARKYNFNSIEDAIEQANRQTNKFMSDPKISKMLEEEGVSFNQQQQVHQTQPVIQQHNVVPDNYKEIYSPSSRQIEPVVEAKKSNQNEYIDPLITMFRKTKRNTDFSISIDIEKKIPRLDTIEMLEDSYETSIIQFLAEEFTNEILSNPDIIKLKIMEELHNMLDNNFSDTKATKKEVEVTTGNLLLEKKQKKNKESSKESSKESEDSSFRELQTMVKELSENNTIEALMGILKKEETKEENKEPQND